MADLSPTGITFGAPKVLKKGGCAALDTKNWFRFVNSIQSQYTVPLVKTPSGLFYDLYPLAYDSVPATRIPSCDHYGYFLVMGYDSTIASVGLDSQLDFRPENADANRMQVKNSDRTNRGYLDRLVAIRATYTKGNVVTYVVRSGFAKSNLCTRDEECESGKCGRTSFIAPRRCQP